jgi:hypothetical protein
MYILKFKFLPPIDGFLKIIVGHSTFLLNDSEDILEKLVVRLIGLKNQSVPFDLSWDEGCVPVTWKVGCIFEPIENSDRAVSDDPRVLWMANRGWEQVLCCRMMRLSLITKFERNLSKLEEVFKKRKIFEGGNWKYEFPSKLLGVLRQR